MINAIIALGLAILLFILMRTWFKQRLTSQYRHHRLPPGPAGRLFLGNYGQISPTHPENDYMRLSEQYGSDVIHVQVFGQHIVCLNSIQAAIDLLDRRGAIYSDRPSFTLYKVMGWSCTLTFLPWGERFKMHRRLFQSTFSISKIKIFQVIQREEARRATREILRAPKDWKTAALLMTTSIAYRIAYGQKVDSQDSPFCKMAAEAARATTNGGIAGTSLVDFVPWARYLPRWLNYSGPLQHARRSRQAIRDVQEIPWNANMQRIDAGVAESSFMTTHLRMLRDGAHSGPTQGMTVDDLKGATSTILIAGGNSSWSTISSCVLFLTKYPEVCKQIQAEIDRVTGETRLPDFCDRPSLGCLERFMAETQRVMPLNPLNIPHRSMRDDVYKDMFVPKGSTVLVNIKAIISDSAVYADPSKFDPDRYLRGEPLPQVQFGLGRRKCPGNHLAMASVYIFLATLLATCDVEMVAGPDGKNLEPQPNVTIGLGG